MKEKACKKCGETKLARDFYKDKVTRDGYKNSCKKCIREYAVERLKIKNLDPDWVIKERDRQRIKTIKRRGCPVRLMQIQAYETVRGVRELIDSSKFELHHWSYLERHHRDVMKVTIKEHKKLHRYLKIDKNKLQFRTLGGELLDTKKKSVTEYARILAEEED